MAMWTPAEITTALWLDASDSSTLTLNGAAVSQWNDKSGNSRHATQANAALQPKYGSVALDGVTIPNGNGTELYMTLPSFSASAGIELFFVARQMQTGSTRNGDICTFSSYTTYQGHFGGGPDSVAMQDFYSTFFSTSRILISSDNVPPGNYIGSIQQSGSAIVGRLNGTQVGSVSATFNGSPSMRQICGNSGYAGTPTFPIIGYAEYVLVQSPSAEDRQKIEGYLAWKWGLEANLPADHPYKSAAPTLNKVSGIVTVNGSPAARTVAVFLRSDFTLLGTTTSDASTGAFEILNGLIPADANALLVTAIDSTDTYNAVSVDYITSVSS